MSEHSPQPADNNDEPKYTPYLVIHDGMPWYASTDIWVVPGNNPNNIPSTPQAAKNNWVWARVWNDGLAPVFNAVVNFYWSDPSTAITRATATLIGTEYISLQPKSHASIYCQTPWVPKVVNNGHECLIVEAFEPLTDPLLYPGTGDFHVVADRHVAQRNVTLSYSTSGEKFLVPFIVTNFFEGGPQTITLDVQSIGIEKPAALLSSLGLLSSTSIRSQAEAAILHVLGLRPEPSSMESFIKELKQAFPDIENGSGLVWTPRVEEILHEIAGDPVTQLDLDSGHCALVLAQLPAPENQAGQAYAYTISQKLEDETLGGILVLVRTGTPEEHTSDEENFEKYLRLDYALRNRPDLVRELVENPTEVLSRLELDAEALRCPEKAHDALRRGELAAQEVEALRDLPLKEILPLIAKIADKLFINWRVKKLPFGLRFVEDQDEEEKDEMSWTATGTFECTWSPGCHADTDG